MERTLLHEMDVAGGHRNLREGKPNAGHLFRQGQEYAAHIPRLHKMSRGNRSPAKRDAPLPSVTLPCQA